MVGRHHRFNGHEHGQTPGDREGQGGLVCRSPWAHKQSDRGTEDNNKGQRVFVSTGVSVLQASDLGSEAASKGIHTPHPLLGYTRPRKTKARPEYGAVPDLSWEGKGQDCVDCSL